MASGRCANELYLAQNNRCRVVCSDVAEPPCIRNTKALFPALDFRTLDVLRDQPPGAYDVVLALSLIWSFDDSELVRFLAFARRALRAGGRLILDPGGPSDSKASRLFHEWFLPIEAYAIALAFTLKHRRRFGVASARHGYRRSLGDIARLAAAAGFQVSDHWETDHLSEPSRSVLLARGPRALASAVGRAIPYVRMITLSAI